MAKKPKTIESLDASLARWKTRLKRAVTMIDKLEKQRKRMAKAATKPKTLPAGVHAKIVDTTVMQMAAPDPTPVKGDLGNLSTVDKLKAAEIDTGIPAFLRRKEPDPVTEQIKAEQAETKKKKAQGRIAKMKAKQSGETKKMPLTGRAALDAIRNG